MRTSHLIIFRQILLFAIGLGALGIGGAVAVHLSLALKHFEEELEDLRRELDGSKESASDSFEGAENFGEKFSEMVEKISEIGEKSKLLEKKSEKLAEMVAATCQKVKTILKFNFRYHHQVVPGSNLGTKNRFSASHLLGLLSLSHLMYNIQSQPRSFLGMRL